MKTIKIFLASSEELSSERYAFGNLVRRLDDIYEKRGIRIKIFEWEDYDAAYNGKRKQDEYNEQLRPCDMFLALFYKKAGRFTMEEFDIAMEEFKKKKSPKIYIYCKELQENEAESEELISFKQKMFNEMGHYWCRFNNNHSLHLNFVMQLLMMENNKMEDLKLEDGHITLDGILIAQMDKLKFASNDDCYQNMKNRLIELPEKIKTLRKRIEKYPDDEDFQYDLQKYLDEYNNLKETFTQHQKQLFSTAKHIAQLQGKQTTDRIKRAIDCFNEGKITDANIILKEAEVDAHRTYEEYLHSKETTEQIRQNVILAIEELILKASTLLADASISIDKRIDQVIVLYTKANEMAMGIVYDTEKHIELLDKFGLFLVQFALYEKAKDIYLQLNELENGISNYDLLLRSNTFDNIGTVYNHLGKYEQALEYYYKALEIRRDSFKMIPPETAISLNNIGTVYHTLSDFHKALEFYKNALNINENVYGQEHIEVACNCNNLGIVYEAIGEYDTAFEYYSKTLKILTTLPNEDIKIANCQNCIGNYYRLIGNYNLALNSLTIAIDLRKNKLGERHPDTANSYSNLGLLYTDIKEYSQALEYHQKAMMIYKERFGEKHPSTSICYNNMGSVFQDQGDFKKALDCYNKALKININYFGENHPQTITNYHNVGCIYCDMGEYSKALEYLQKAANERKIILGENHLETALSYYSIGIANYCLDNYQEAYNYYNKALIIHKKLLGDNHPYTQNIISDINLTKEML